MRAEMKCLLLMLFTVVLSGCVSVPDEPQIPAHYQGRYDYCVAHPEAKCPGYENFHEKRMLRALKQGN